MILALLLAASAESFDLENGSQATLAPDAEARGVGVAIFYRAGFAEEPAGRAHVAHLAEHMAVRRAAYDAAGYVNAETMADHTRLNFYVDDAAGLTAIFEAEGARLRDGAIEEDRLDVERERALSELDGATAKFKFAMMALVQVLRHGATEVRLRDSTGALTADQVREFAYPTDGAFVSLAGDFDAAEARALVERTIGAVPRRDVAAPWRSVEAGEPIRATWDAGVAGVFLVWPSEGLTAEERTAVMAFGQSCLSNDAKRFGTCLFWPPDRFPVFLWRQVEPGGDVEAARAELEELARSGGAAGSLNQARMALRLWANPPPVQGPGEPMLILQQRAMNVGMAWLVRGGQERDEYARVVTATGAGRTQEIVRSRLDPSRARVVYLLTP